MVVCCFLYLLFGLFGGLCFAVWLVFGCCLVVCWLCRQRQADAMLYGVILSQKEQSFLRYLAKQPYRGCCIYNLIIQSAHTKTVQEPTLQNYAHWFCYLSADLLSVTFRLFAWLSVLELATCSFLLRLPRMLHVMFCRLVLSVVVGGCSRFDTWWYWACSLPFTPPHKTTKFTEALALARLQENENC